MNLQKVFSQKPSKLQEITANSNIKVQHVPRELLYYYNKPAGNKDNQLCTVNLGALHLLRTTDVC